MSSPPLPLIPQQPHWTQPPPSPPSQIHQQPHLHSQGLELGPIAIPSISRGITDTLSSLSIQSQSQATSLPTPSPGGSTTTTTNQGVLSPPTPAPSPSPRRNKQSVFHSHPHSDVDDDDREDDEEDLFTQTQRWKGKSSTWDRAPEDLLAQFNNLSRSQRFAFLNGLVGELRLNEALVVSRKIAPLLRRDFLRELPLELSLHCLSFVDEPKTLARAARVSQYWNTLLQDEATWKDLFQRSGFPYVPPLNPSRNFRRNQIQAQQQQQQSQGTMPRCIDRVTPFGLERRVAALSLNPPRNGGERPDSFKSQFKNAYLTESNWLSRGRILANHISADDVVVTTLCFDNNYIVIGMANSKIHIFDAITGEYRRSLVGHDQGVWALVLVSCGSSKKHNSSSSKDGQYHDDHHTDPFTRSSYGAKASGAYRDEGQSRRSSFNGSIQERYAPRGGGSFSSVLSSSPQSAPRPNTAMGFTQVPSTGFGLGIGEAAFEHVGGRYTEAKKMKQSDVCGAARGWPGNKRNLVISGGCDREVKVWDINTGECIHSLPGHTSTIRCLKVLDGRPVAISGSRDFSLRVWDIEHGRLIHTLSGHEHSVRSLEVAGNMAVSGSYDFTARLWNVDNGQCVHVLRGHYHQIYSVAFDGQTIVTGSLDSTIRVWSAATGDCLALLQGHTALVGQLQLSDTRLVTGGSDGRVIIFDLVTLTCQHRLCAHDNSVTTLQFDDRFIVSGGNDGRVKLWDVRTGRFIRELTRPCDAVWRVSFRGDRVVVLCQRDGRTCLEVVSFRPGEGERRAITRV